VSKGVAVASTSGSEVVLPKEGKGKVRLVSGANEVVRPFSGSWMKEIARGQEEGTLVTARLVGGMEVDGVMTRHGEVMLIDEKGQ